MTDEMRAREEAICEVANVDDIGEVSDGFHTFNSLYEQRMILFAALVKAYKDKSWKSYRHEDGEYCFGGGWFIVGIDTPEGSYTYHYENKYWDMFDCIDLPRAKHWDGHTEKDVTRLLSLPDVSDTNVGDTISRQAAIDCVSYDVEHTIQCLKALPPAQPDNQTNLCDSCGYSYPECPSKNDDVIFGNGIGNDNICACNKYKPSAQPHLITEIQNGIKVTDTDDVYSCGMRNGMRWCMSLIDSKEPLYENCPSVQPDHVADVSKKVEAEDLISRQAAIDAIMGQPPEPHYPSWYAAQIEKLPAVRPEIIRCKDCKYMIDAGDDLMCDNAKGWVVATASDFGCVLAERRTDE